MAETLVVDMSHYQTVTDWAALRASGIAGVIHKCTEGVGYVDPTFEEHRKGALEAGLLWGAYHFLRPGDMEAQARAFLAAAMPEEPNSIPGLPNVPDYPLLAADHEDAGVSLDDLKLFLKTIVGSGYDPPLIYSGSLIKEQLGDAHDTTLADYPLWLAQYTEGDPSWPEGTWEEWFLWQYTDKGSVPGVDGAIDVSRFVGTQAELAHEWRNIAPPSPSPPPSPSVIDTVTITLEVPRGTIVRLATTGPIRVMAGD